MPRDPSNLLSLAAISFPLIALVVTFSIDAVGENDTISYRGTVGGLSLAAIVAGGIAVLLALIGYYEDQFSLKVIWYVGIAFTVTAALSVLVVTVEVIRGIENDQEIVWVFVIVGILLALLELTFRRIGL